MAAFVSHASVQTIPQELTEHVLAYCEPRDLARLAATCRTLRDIVYNENDQVVWRNSFLSLFDDPRKTLPTARADAPEVDWRGELQRRVRAENVLADKARARLSDVAHEDRMVDLNEDRPIHAALRTLVSAVFAAPPGSTDTSENLAWVESVFLRSPLFVDLVDQPNPWSGRSISGSAAQLVAQLQTYLALSYEDGKTKESQKRLVNVRTASRCFVYDLRKYQPETLWGPYLRDNRRRLKVNWEHVRHIQNVVLMNLRDFPESWKKIWPEWRIQSTRALSAPGIEKRKPWDWAGVEGKWRRVVCFMDYRFVLDHCDKGPEIDRRAWQGSLW